MTDSSRFDGEFDTDEVLRARLRHSDPARSLPPADPAALAHLLEDIMSSDLDVRPASPLEGTRSTGTHGRSRLTWLVAAAAAVVIAGAGGFAISSFSGGDDTPPTASSEPAGTDAGVDDGAAAPDNAPDNAPVAGITELTAGSAPARCAVPSAAFIAQQQQAFAGTVTAIDGDAVTLQTTDVFTGEVAQTVVVRAAQPELQALIQATSFQVGGTYLVSATDGQVSVCGMSGKATGELQSLYDTAFFR